MTVPPPPAGAPPVLLEDPAVREVRTQGPLTMAGLEATAAVFRHIVLDTRIELAEGSEDDLYGVFLRQSDDDRFVAWGLSPAGRIVLAIVDVGVLHPLFEATLPEDVPFARGLGAVNRLQVVACGPVLVPVLNGTALLPLEVDPRYAEGRLGWFVRQGAAAPVTVARAHGVEVRSVLP